MNTSGEAAEQVVRMSLDGVEVVLKIAGAGAKNIAAMIYAALKDTDKNKVKGRARLISMLKSGKELSIFSVKNEDLKKFASEAKRYGIVYHPMRNTKDKDGVIDVMVYSADAPRINRIVERFKLATVDIASIKSELQKSKEHTPPEKSAEDKLLDELLTKPQQKEAREQEKPEAAKTAKSRPSEPILTRSGKSEKGASDMQRKSVREALSEIKRARKQEAEKPQREERQTSEKPQQQRTTKHQQPQSRKRGAKSKSKER